MLNITSSPIHFLYPLLLFYLKSSALAVIPHSVTHRAEVLTAFFISGTCWDVLRDLHSNHAAQQTGAQPNRTTERSRHAEQQCR